MNNENERFTGSSAWTPLAALLLAAATSTGALAHGSSHHGPPPPPIVLDSSGGFVIGGKVIDTATGEAPTGNRSLSCDHGYVEYFLPAKPRQTSLVLWHSSSAQVWQNRWDGGPGYKDMMLRANYPTYIWDGPRVGRANWSCASITYNPGNRDQGNFSAWKFGPAAPAGLVPAPDEWYPGVQFPINNTQAWLDATRSRYNEFDTGANVELQTDVAAVAADSGRLGDQIVYLTNSAGGLRAMLTASKATGHNIAGMVTYESIGYIFPEGDPESPTQCSDPGGETFSCAFGPILVPPEDFKKLASLHIQFVWGDNRPEDYSFVIQSRLCAKLINKYAEMYHLPGHAEVLKLADDAGLTGSTHIAFADMDNDKVAALLFKFLKKSRLDRYDNGHGHGHHW